MTTTATKSRGIMFTGESVRAILAGTKTQTRRVVKFRSFFTFPHVAYKSVWPHPGGGWVFCDCERKPDGWEPHTPKGMTCPLGEPGDRLWVKERYRLRNWNNSDEVQFEYSDGALSEWMDAGDDGDVWIHNALRKLPEGYEEDPSIIPWRTPLFMPRWASRLTLEIESVRVERVTDISEADAESEGITMGYGAPSAKEGFALRWDAINGNRPGCAWADSPFVWAITFRRSEVA